MSAFHQISNEAAKAGAQLVAVSKTRPNEAVMQIYNQGQRLFAENRVQDLLDKAAVLPNDIQWHLIGHLQTNKVKYIAPFIAMIHAIDSWKLLEECQRQAAKHQRNIRCLLQLHIAEETTKFGFSKEELIEVASKFAAQPMPNIILAGIMTMATNTNDTQKISSEFETAHQLFLELKNKVFHQQPEFCELSMGMSSDYRIALQHGATLIRVGSLLFQE
ncbi:MAG: YggS family pyridoxal phosphate-dependent enzyme [Chitinophagales bacterium]